MVAPAPTGPEIDTYTPPSGLTLGASDAAVVLGLHPYADSTPWKVWAEQCGMIAYRGGADNAVKRRGKRAEAMIGLEYADSTKCQIMPNTAKWPVYPWLHATPDFLASDGPEIVSMGIAAVRWFVEAKSVRIDEWGDEPPPHVLIQALLQRAAGRAASIVRTDVVAWFTMSDEFRTFPVQADVALEDRLIVRMWSWYRRHVIAGEPPPVDDRAATGRVMAQVYSAVTGSTVTASNADVERLRQLAVIREQMGRLEERKTLLENELRASIGGAVRLLHPVTGKPLASWTQESRARVDWGAVMRDHFALVDRYRTGERVRRLNILKAGKETGGSDDE